jgi:hypothetical protein
MTTMIKTALSIFVCIGLMTLLSEHGCTVTVDGKSHTFRVS